MNEEEEDEEQHKKQTIEGNSVRRLVEAINKIYINILSHGSVLLYLFTIFAFIYGKRRQLYCCNIRPCIYVECN